MMDKPLPTKNRCEMSSDSLLRKDLPIDLLDKNPDNPNTMSAKGFNLLVDNVATMGITDPILVRQVHERYRIVGGHHRVEAAKLLGYTEIPCTIITDPAFDEDQEKFQLMRHNMIRGKLDAGKFVKMYEDLQQKYSQEALTEAFGFEEQSELKKLITSTQKSLPPEMQKQFKEAAKEVKSIKDLSNLLNRLFTSYGDTLPHGFMFMDFGGRESVWIRMQSHDMDVFKKVGQICVEKNKTLDGLLRIVLQLIAQGKIAELEDALKYLPDAKGIAAGVELPTEEALANLPD